MPRKLVDFKDAAFTRKVGLRLRAARDRAGFTMEEVADAGAGRSRGTIQNWEGGRNFPELPRLMVLADLYGVSLDWLLWRVEDDADEANLLAAYRSMSEVGQEALLGALQGMLRREALTRSPSAGSG